MERSTYFSTGSFISSQQDGGTSCWGPFKYLYSNTNLMRKERGLVSIWSAQMNKCMLFKPHTKIYLYNLPLQIYHSHSTHFLYRLCSPVSHPSMHSARCMVHYSVRPGNMDQKSHPSIFRLNGKTCYIPLYFQ